MRNICVLILLAVMAWAQTPTPRNRVPYELPYDSVDCDNADGNPALCTVEEDEINPKTGFREGTLDPANPVYFTSNGTPYQCGPMSYYGALCWQPDGVRNAPSPPKGFMWELIPESLPKKAGSQ